MKAHSPMPFRRPTTAFRHTPVPMLSKLLLAGLLAASSAAPLTCVGVGSQCSTDANCCPSKGTDAVNCEAVNQYFSKCVVQPTCAAKGSQCAGSGNTPMREVACCDEGWSCVARDEHYSHCTNGVPPPSPPSPPPLQCAASEAAGTRIGADAARRRRVG